MLRKSLLTTLISAALGCSLFAQSGTKAYNTLNFGDSSDVAEDKIAKLLHGPTANAGDFNGPMDRPDSNVSRWWSGYGQFLWENSSNYRSPNDALQTYFGRGKNVEILSVDGFNDTQEISCGIFNTKGDAAHSGLAIVVVNYQDVPQDELTEKFMVAYPQAKKTTKSFTAPSDKHPGFVIQYEREFLGNESAGMEIKLSLPTKKFAFQFKNLSQMSEKETQVWDQLANQARVSRDQYYNDVKTDLIAAQQQIMAATSGKLPRHPMDALTYLGWYDSNDAERAIFGPPVLVVKSNTLIDYHLSKYDRSIQEALDKKAQEKKSATDKALGF